VVVEDRLGAGRKLDLVDTKRSDAEFRPYPFVVRTRGGVGPWSRRHR
jgi:hypothetical protein